MKTKAIIFLSAMLALTACSNDDDMMTEPKTDGTATAITFNLTASHPDDAAQTRGAGGGTGWQWESWGDEDAEAQGATRATTRAVKTGWESGDAIFVFFDNIAAPKHLKMTYDGSAWTYTEYDGATATAGALGLTNGMTGTMRAVFLPFGSTATVSADGTSFKFSETKYSYYLTATLAYTVADNTVSGAFDMTIPEGFVQFFVTGDISGFTLGCDAVIPTGIVSIEADGTVVETSGMPFMDGYYNILSTPYALDLPGYSYGDGYIYSGKLYADYGYKDIYDNDAFHSYGSNYYFALSSGNHSSRKDYFVTGKTLASHSAVKLPNFNNDKWIAVGADRAVTLGEKTYSTCNYGSSYPENVGTFKNFNDAKTATDNKLLNVHTLANDCSHTPLSIHGYCGMVVYQEANFIFLPSAGSIPYSIPSSMLFEKFYWGYETKYLEFSTDKFEVKTTGGYNTVSTSYQMCVRSSW